MAFGSLAHLLIRSSAHLPCYTLSYIVVWFSSVFNVHNFIVVMLIYRFTMVIIAYLIHFYSFITAEPFLFYYSHSSSEQRTQRENHMHTMCVHICGYGFPCEYFALCIVYTMGENLCTASLMRWCRWFGIQNVLTHTHTIWCVCAKIQLSALYTVCTRVKLIVPLIFHWKVHSPKI